MEKIIRDVVLSIRSALQRGKSILLLGPRQVGKTTLLEELPIDHIISLARPAIRQQYEQNIESFSQEIEAIAEEASSLPLIAIDEIQKVPELMDAVQDLIDRKIAQFVLTGSSARKLRQSKALNWLPGRIVHFYLDPLILNEVPKNKLNLESLLTYGSLPGIILEQTDAAREQDLQSYVVTYLEEEIRQEALVRKIGDFARFLELAAIESGNITNFNAISQAIGVAQTTVTGYYQILEDCLIAARIMPFTKTTSARRRLVKSSKYLFFDLGVRRLAAQEDPYLSQQTSGHLFEQWVGLELLRLTRLDLEKKIKLYFWRDLEGREVDWVLTHSKQQIPIEVKWTDKPSLSDARHLNTFLDDYDSKKGYIICRIDKARKIDERITALPWHKLSTILNAFDNLT